MNSKDGASNAEAERETGGATSVDHSLDGRSGEEMTGLDRVMENIPNFIEGARKSINETSDAVLKTLEWCVILGVIGYAKTLFQSGSEAEKLLGIVHGIASSYFVFWLVLNVQHHLLLALGHRYSRKISSHWVGLAQILAILAAGILGYFIVSAIVSVSVALATISP